MIDLLMGLTAVLIGTSLLARSSSVAELMKEGDDRWRAHPVFSKFEPSSGPLQTDEGRYTVLRGWLLFWSTGFVLVGAGLLTRALVAVA